MSIQEFKTIDDVWTAINEGKTVYCGNTSYKVYPEAVTNPNVKCQQYSARNGMLLSVRCISNYFGSVISEQDLPCLFTLNRNIEE